MKLLKFAWIICVLILSACGGKTTVYTGPSANVGPVSISAHFDNTGKVVLGAEFSQTLVGVKTIAAISWDLGFSQTLNDAQNLQYTLFILYKDNNGNIIQQQYNINQPFDITFANEQWVKEIKHTGNGNIIVYVEPNPMSAAVPASTNAIATSAPISISAPTKTPRPPSPNPTPYPILGTPCPDAPPTRIDVGNLVRVITTDGDPLILRSSPNVGDNWVYKLREGMTLRVLDGPACANNFVFWHVQMTSAPNIGWAAEGDNDLYFLEPIY
jgi:hypothetical protein